ncbi:MAG: hypothetical protein QG574_2013 [Cyanobacteriota bacterium erpe_2018_sw_21hr_WHONDRS-SW48-000092_B_bin.40]|jgi:hypothetical protein|nr:hypothetical protein [Cyanobacteriota bacterium erpe_2018_sw_21hr_WHONDRS-SW48-000092_B_bin.40]
MKGSDDYASRRPRPRPSAPPPASSQESSQESQREFLRDNSPYSNSRGELSNTSANDEYADEQSIDDDFARSNSKYSSNARRRPSTAGRNTPSTSKSKGKSRAEKETEKKEKAKRLRTLLSNQAICLVIIFALVAGFNWMATDCTGEYITQDNALGLVKLSLVREAGYVDGELSYKDTTNLEMQPGDQPKDQQIDLTFVAADPKLISRGLITRARFIGAIDGSIAEGAIVDAKGSHDVKLTKNVVASLFKQLQHHTPSVPLPRPPKLFQVPNTPPPAPLPNETDSTKPFTYGGTSAPSKAP